ncbi:MAG: RNA polymerase sigma-54 factor, partial [Duncaniella sp.]|nr:RNA polymerase sigma-54 factor [Duncaniella sp.]
MKESLKLSLTQKLQQRLSPLQMRFVRMLEMNGPEVEDEVRRELDDNPALEVADRADSITESDSYDESAEQLQMADYRDEDDIPTYRLEARNHSVNDEYFEPVAVAEVNSMMDSLMAQLSETDMPESQLAVARYIIGNIDDNGYLTRTLSQLLDDLAFNAGLEITMDELR